jgi:hypothetical protein
MLPVLLPDWHPGCFILRMVIAVLMVGVCVIIEVYTVLGAPLGYQDETGFHVGREKR